MKVIKVGGSCLKNAHDFKLVADLIVEEKDKKVVVLSAINGITDKILSAITGNKMDRRMIDCLIKDLGTAHNNIIDNGVKDRGIIKLEKHKISEKLRALEKLIDEIQVHDATDEKERDLILSYGERLSVIVLEAFIRSRNINVKILESEELGIITDSNFGNATVSLLETEQNLKKSLLPILDNGYVPLITGFFGCDRHGNTTILGRNGTDYSASAIAYSINADIVEIWKDVDGFMSGDPGMVSNVKTLKFLSYDEASELAYFGARILHPRTIEPLKLKHIPLRIKNLYNKQSEGTLISDSIKNIKNGAVKSIAYIEEIGAVKIYGISLGSTIGTMNKIAGCLAEKRVNIKSVITSQTCITILLEKDDVESGYDILSKKGINAVERFELIKGISLIALVGDGIVGDSNIMVAGLKVMADLRVSIKMFAAGASNVAVYFIVSKDQLKSSIKAIHKNFLEIYS